MMQKGFSSILILIFLFIVILAVAFGVFFAGRSLSEEKINEVTAVEDK